MALISLRDGIAEWTQRSGGYTNAYDWYRRGAADAGLVRLGSVSARAEKLGGTWYVEGADVERAIAVQIAENEQVAQKTADLRRGILHGAEGEVVRIEGGWYRREGDFRFVYSDYAAGRHRSDGDWFCNRCNAPASTEHNNPECHRCADGWRPCRDDCALSAVTCRPCGARLEKASRVAVGSAPGPRFKGPAMREVRLDTRAICGLTRAERGAPIVTISNPYNRLASV